MCLLYKLLPVFEKQILANLLVLRVFPGISWHIFFNFKTNLTLWYIGKSPITTSSFLIRINLPTSRHNMDTEWIKREGNTPDPRSCPCQYSEKIINLWWRKLCPPPFSFLNGLAIGWENRIQNIYINYFSKNLFIHLLNTTCSPKQTNKLNLVSVNFKRRREFWNKEYSYMDLRSWAN